MDPTGGLGLWLLLGVVVAGVLLWLFAPIAWAVGITVGLAVVVIGFILYVLSNARYT